MPVDTLERAVLLGRSPVWRQLWDERLTEEHRREISRAARRGEDLQDPFHAALAAGWAHRRKRAIQLNLTLFPLTLALIAAQIWGNCLGERGGAVFCAVFIAIAVLAMGVVPIIAVRSLRTLASAEERNRRVYSPRLKLSTNRSRRGRSDRSSRTYDGSCEGSRQRPG